MNEQLKEESKSQGDGAKLVCPECGNTNVKTSQKDYSFTYGVGEDEVQLSAEVSVRTCVDCGFSFLDHTAEDICHEAVCRHLGVMTPKEIKDLRDFYSLTQAKFSEITKLGGATLSRWERGIVIQNQAYDNYLYLLRLPLNFERIRSRTRRSEAQEEQSAIISNTRFRALEPTEALKKRQRTFKLRPDFMLERSIKCM